MKAICVTGVAGAGKTYFAKKFSKENKYAYVDVNNLIEENKEIVSGFDKKFKTDVIDVKKLNKILIKIINNSKDKLVIDSHLSHYLDRRHVEKVYVVKTDIKKLRSRLKKRGYNKDKVEENVEAELMNVCVNESKELGHNVEVVEN